MTYSPYLVAPFSSGISTYLKPWLQPEEALTSMEDCYTYRGSVQKRYGYSIYGVFPTKVGLKNVGVGNGVLTTFSPTLDYTPVGKRSLTITHTQGGTTYTDGIDDGAGNITGTNIAAGSTINYATGAVVLNFTAAPTINTPIRIDYGVRIAIGDGAAVTFPFTLPSTGAFALPILSRSLFIRNTSTNQNTAATGDTPLSDGLTGTLGPGTAGMTGTITYATGVGSITFNSAPPAAAADQDIWARWQFEAPANPIKGIKFFWDSTGAQNTIVFNNNQAAILTPTNFSINNITGSNIFTTATTNFFSVANYQNKIFILNNTDRLAIYDGTNFYQPIISFTNATPTVNELSTGLFIFIYKNRLVILRPTETNIVKPQRARFSALNNPLDWRSNINGAGGFIDAPTPEWIVGAEFLRDELIVHFQDSTWKLRYTGVDTNPFRWEKINDSRRVDAPYATVGYQNFTTALGTTGFIRCDGVNVERYDDKIIDYITDNIDLENIQNCNSYRFDFINQQLICHPSPGSTDTDYSDKWLVWNFLENAFSVWNIDSTCFGSYFLGQDLTWDDFTAANNLDWSWDDVSLQNASWRSFFSQGKTQVPLFGDKNGNIFQLLPFFATDNGTNTGFTFTSIDFNPFVKEGQQCRLGFIDFYFDAPETDDDLDTDYQLSIDFYLDEEEVPYQTVILNPSEDDWRKKRVYSGAIGNFHRFRIYLSPHQITNSTVATKGFTLNGFILYMAPGGRIIA